MESFLGYQHNYSSSMSLQKYGVLKGKAIETKKGTGNTPHFQVLISDDKLLYRLAINVESQEPPSDVLYFVDENFQHPIKDLLQPLPKGYSKLESKPGGLALDFIRGNLFDTTLMKPLPHDLPGENNDLNELVQKYMDKAISIESSEIYAFGERWGPEEERDKFFGFTPGNGIHDIHMNQGSSAAFAKYDGVWQDGGVIIHLPDDNKWIAIFLAFQSQCFHTDDVQGHRIPDVCDKVPGKPAAKGVCIIAALVNPNGPDMGLETVTLLNTTPDAIDLNGWALADKNKKKMTLSSSIGPGETLKVALSGKDIELSNNGGIITLLDKKGLKVDGVSFTKEQASKVGWTIVF
jgi:uncharacterized protein YukJ